MQAGIVFSRVPGCARRPVGRASFAAALALVALAAQGRAAFAGPAFFLVDTTDDVHVGDCSAGLAADCSLRDALTLAANGDTIQFDPLVFKTSAPGIIAVTQAPLPPVTQGKLTIEGDYRAVIIDGTSSPAGSDGLTVTSNGNAILGLTVRNFDGDGIVVDGGASNAFGSCATESRANRLQDNGGYGMRITGEAADNTSYGRNYAGPGNGLGGLIIVDGPDTTTLGCGFTGQTFVPATFDQNLGDGVIARGPSVDGVVFLQTEMANNARNGILVDGNATNVRENGGLEQVHITGNGLDGVRVVAGSGVRFPLNNTVAYLTAYDTANGGLAFNLVGPSDPANGVTPNDEGDGDSGPNGLLNTPVISAVTAKGGGVVTVSGTACASCSVFVYRSSDDASGHGELPGPLPLGVTSANAGGAFAVDVTLPGGASVTAAAVDASGNMSELALNVSGPRVLIIDTKSDLGSLSACTSAAADCSFRGALSVAANGDYVQFDGSVFNNATPIMVQSQIPTITAGLLTFEGNYTTVILDGSQAPAGTNGLVFGSGKNTIAGLTVQNFKGDGLVIQNGANNVIGSCANDARATRLMNNTGYGVRITGEGSDNTSYQRNYAGPGNGLGGLVIADGPDTTAIGCGYSGFPFVPAAFDGNTGDGVTVLGPSTTAVVFYQSQMLNNGKNGILVDGGSDVHENGGTEQVHISGNGQDGVRVVSGDRVRFALNHNVSFQSAFITNNGGLAINLVAPGDAANGVTPNDDGDVDSGPNGLLNTPVVASVTSKGGGVVGVSGTACAGCTVFLYRSSDDASGHGELPGPAPLAVVTANSSGAFAADLALPGGASVTAAAVDASGNMSELAQNVAGPRVLQVDTKSDAANLSACTSAAADCSLRGALSVVATGDYVQFDGTVFNNATPIMVQSALPTITAGLVTFEGNYSTVIIDGSQAPVGTDGLVFASGKNTIAGLTVQGFKGDGIVIQGGANNIVGSCATESRSNRLLNNTGYGVRITGEAADSTSYQRNYAGPGNGLGGLIISDGPDTTNIGCGFTGSQFQAATFDSNTGDGVTVRGPSTTGVVFYQSQMLNNGKNGILVDGGSDVHENGGIEQVHISGNGQDGVRVVSGDRVRFPLNNTVAYLSAYNTGNGGLAFNLVAASDPASGVTVNDDNDADSGPNNLLNYPEVRSIVSQSNNVYTVRGLGCAGCTVWLYHASNDASGHGESVAPGALASAVADGLGVWQATVSYGTTDVNSAIALAAVDASGNMSELGVNANIFQFIAITDVCGQRGKEPSEECDDGNTTSGDGCSAVCTLETCGDGIVQPLLGEQCDGVGDDGDGCTVNDPCVACHSQVGSPKDCGDGDACTTDSCSGNGVCGHAAITCGTGACDPTVGCVTCTDNASGTDPGCSAPTPECKIVNGQRACVGCDDNSQCATHLCAGDQCVVCAPGDGAIDVGCSAAAPVCDPSGGPHCVVCAGDGDCGADSICVGGDACVYCPLGHAHPLTDTVCNGEDDDYDGEVDDERAEYEPYTCGDGVRGAVDVRARGRRALRRRTARPAPRSATASTTTATARPTTCRRSTWRSSPTPPPSRAASS
ncbi:MAG: right-handed parallel beta-helix repeat-containing protein [Myxococcota bacterium]